MLKICPLVSVAFGLSRFQSATLVALTPCRDARRMSVSPWWALTVILRNTNSGASSSWPLSARCSVTSLSSLPWRGTSKVDPALTSMRAGMPLTLRSCSADMPTCLATSSAGMVRGACQAVQLDRRRSECACRLV